MSHRTEKMEKCQVFFLLFHNYVSRSWYLWFYFDYAMWCHMIHTTWYYMVQKRWTNAKVCLFTSTTMLAGGFQLFSFIFTMLCETIWYAQSGFTWYRNYWQIQKFVFSTLKTMWGSGCHGNYRFFFYTYNLISHAVELFVSWIPNHGLWRILFLWITDFMV